MIFVERKFLPLFFTLLAVFVLFGISVTAVGASLPRILDEFGWDYGAIGIVLASGAAGFFLATYGAGRIIDRIKGQAAIAIGIGLLGAGLAIFAALPSFTLNALLYGLIGAGQGFVEVSINWIVLRMDREGRSLNFTHGAFSLGAVIGPFVVALLFSAGLPWELVYRYMAGMYAFILFIILILPFKALGAPDTTQNGGSLSGAAYKAGAAALFLYVGIEFGISNWLAELFVRVFGSTESFASSTVAIFWIGLLAGRIMIPLIFPKSDQGRILIVLGASLSLSAGLLAASTLVGRPALIPALLAAALAGLSSSAIYPTIMAIVGRAYPDSQGRAIGILAAGGGLGNLFFPFLMSRIAKSSGLKAGFTFYAVLGILTALACLVVTHSVRARIRRGLVD